MRHDQSRLPEAKQPSSGLQPQVGNPDEIAIDDDDDEEAGFDAPSGGAAAVQTASTASQNPDEITLEGEIETVEPPPPPPLETKFLALDKCLPRRQFLEASVPSHPQQAVVDTPHPLGGRYPCTERWRFPTSCSGTVIRSRMARYNARLSAVSLAASGAGDVPGPRRGTRCRRARVGLGASACAAEAR